MKRQSLLILLCVLVFACNRGRTIVDPGPEDIIIKSGASFGECLGYCWREVEINQTDVQYVESGWVVSEIYPALMFSGNISVSEWYVLTESIDLEIIKSMSDVYGCPDCADGGSEWIEIIRGDFSKKITFEFGKSLPEIQQILDRVRLIRMRFENQARSVVLPHDEM